MVRGPDPHLQPLSDTAGIQRPCPWLKTRAPTENPDPRETCCERFPQAGIKECGRRPSRSACLKLAMPAEKPWRRPPTDSHRGRPENGPPDPVNVSQHHDPDGRK